MSATPQEGSGADVYDDGYLYLEHDRFYLSFGGKPLYKISRTDFKILSRLLRSPGRPVTGREIWRSVRGREAEYNGSSLRVHLTYLRQKLAPYGVNIIHEAGSGYRVQVAPPTKVAATD
jgi:DNA-binding response OmpR family regulator